MLALVQKRVQSLAAELVGPNDKLQMIPAGDIYIALTDYESGRVNRAIAFHSLVIAGCDGELATYLLDSVEARIFRVNLTVVGVAPDKAVES